MSTPGEKLILMLLSQSVERVNKTCSLGTPVNTGGQQVNNGHQVNNDLKANDGTTNSDSYGKSDDRREIHVSDSLKCSNKVIKKKNRLKNKSADTTNHNSIDIVRNSETTPEKSKFRRYFKNAKRKHFTQAEVDILLKAMKKHGDNVDYKEVAKKLGRDQRTVKTKIYHLKVDSGPRRAFSLMDDKVIMDTYLKKLVSGHKFKLMGLGTLPMSELLQLSLNIKRQHGCVHERWRNVLHPWILQYFSGTLNLQVVPMLTSFLAANFSGIDSIDWSVVVSKPEFAGHTESSLRYLLHCNMNNLKRYSNIHEVDLLLLKEFTEQKLKEGKFNKTSDRKETRQMDVVKYFQEFVDKNNITDIFE